MWDAAFTCRASDSFFPRLHQRIVCAFIVKADLGASSFTWHLGEQRKLNTVPYSCFFFFLNIILSVISISPFQMLKLTFFPHCVSLQLE